MSVERWASGLSRRAFTPENAGSNPARSTIIREVIKEHWSYWSTHRGTPETIQEDLVQRLIKALD